MFFLILRFWFFYNNQSQLTQGQKINFETTILSQPQIIGSQQVYTANYQNQSFGGLRIKITTNRFPEINYGDFVQVSGKVSKKNNRVAMYFPEIKIINNSSNIFQAGLQSINTIRQKIISLFSQTLPMPSSNLMLGIIFGIKEQMPKDFSDNLKNTGVFHVIAASGMNVTLVGGFISTLFAFFLKRQIAVGLSILGIVFYAILAGLEPSIIRASIMGILVFSAQILGRQTLAINGLFLAGFAMLFIDPTLLSDIGFQLSFAATLGILYIKRLPTTISAQIATLPILLVNFGNYSIYSILVNGLVLWTVPILMVIGGLGAILGLIFMPLGQILIYICYPLLLYFETVVKVFGSIGGVLTVKNLPWQFIISYYCLLTAVLSISRKKE